MIDDLKSIPPRAGTTPVRKTPRSQKPKLLQLPGLIAIGLYMLLLAVAVTIDVARNPAQKVLLVFAVFFIAAGAGLMMLRRWAWALTLAAAAMLSGLFLWMYVGNHTFPYLAYGLLNLVIFLYLVRTDVREKLL